MWITSKYNFYSLLKDTFVSIRTGDGYTQYIATIMYQILSTQTVMQLTHEIDSGICTSLSSEPAHYCASTLILGCAIIGNHENLLRHVIMPVKPIMDTGE